MALLGNYSVLNKSCAQFTNGTSTAGAYAAVTPSNYQNNGMRVNRFGGPTGFADHAALPVGYIPPYSFALPKKSGGLATFKGMSASISTTNAQLALGVNLDADLSATMTETNAILALIVALQANLSASGSITDANMAIILLLQANLSASGTLTDAQLGNILNLSASLSANMTLTNSITNLVNLSANISNAAAGLTAASISEEMLDNQDIETGYTLRESLKLILASLTGKVSGAGTTTITIRDVNDAVDRIVATVDANGNRTSVTKDVT
jgi:hypothetical protein